MHIQAIPAFNDNYIWLLINPSNRKAVCVDPGDASVVIDHLKKQQLDLVGILVTHHHWDHTGGISELVKYYQPKVYCSYRNNIPQRTHALHNNDVISIPNLEIELNILEIPGHTLDHICFYAEGMLFCGDTLFAAGCGKVFEGTMAEMYNSLLKISHLPDATQIYCGHEYTLNNLKFASLVEPDNAAIKNRLAEIQNLRDQNKITLPSTLSIEKQTNPFLRCHLPSLQKAASNYSGKTITDPITTFTIIREWKNSL